MNIGGIESPKSELAVSTVNWLSPRSSVTVTVSGAVLDITISYFIEATPLFARGDIRESTRTIKSIESGDRRFVDDYE
jgi:hypothetical protein